MSPIRPGCEGAAGRTLEDEMEGTVMSSRPFGYDVRDDATVVVAGQLHVPSGGDGDVESVHPRVAGIHDVEQVADRPAGLARHRRSERPGSLFGRRAGSASDCAGRHVTAGGGDVGSAEI